MIANVPDEVREALALTPGGFVAYQIDGDTVTMTRNPYPLDEEGLPDMFVGNLSTFTEWDSEADRMYDQLRDR